MRLVCKWIHYLEKYPWCSSIVHPFILFNVFTCVSFLFPAIVVSDHCSVIYQEELFLFLTCFSMFSNFCGLLIYISLLIWNYPIPVCSKQKGDNVRHWTVKLPKVTLKWLPTLHPWQYSTKPVVLLWGCPNVCLHVCIRESVLQSLSWR